MASNMAFVQKTVCVLLFVCAISSVLKRVNSQGGRGCRRRTTCASCTDNESGCNWCQPQDLTRDGFCGSPSKISRRCDGEASIGGNYFKEEASVKCNSIGTYECGRCNCDEGYYGKFCECDAWSSSEDSCRMFQGSKLCEGNGECVCGMCDCHPIHPYTLQRFSGQFCECNDYSCDFFAGMLCGGADRGVCSCGQCICSPGYTGSACECTMSQEKCMASNGRVCNDRGHCQCDVCVCDQYAKGPTCEELVDG